MHRFQNKLSYYTNHIFSAKIKLKLNAYVIHTHHNNRSLYLLEFQYNASTKKTNLKYRVNVQLKRETLF